MMSEQNQPQPENGNLAVKAFITGAVYTIACRLSVNFYEWWEHAPWATANNETALMLSAPLTCLVFLIIIWITQQISRYYFGYRGFAFSERGKPVEANGFLAFMLGAFITHIFLSILTVLL